MYTVLHPKHHTVAIAGPVPKDRILSVLQEITIWVEIPDPWGPPPPPALPIRTGSAYVGHTAAINTPRRGQAGGN